jgi:hypothetical protein
VPGLVIVGLRPQRRIIAQIRLMHMSPRERGLIRLIFEKQALKAKILSIIYYTISLKKL